MHRGMIRRLFGVLLGLFLLTGCAQPTPSPAAIPEEEMPPPVTVPFNVSPEEQPTIERPPSLYLNPASISLEVGETATVQVWAEGVGGIYALFLEMGFDPLLVQVVDADPMAEGVQAAPGNLMGLVLENKVEGEPPGVSCGGSAGYGGKGLWHSGVPVVAGRRAGNHIAQDGAGYGSGRSR